MNYIYTHTHICINQYSTVHENQDKLHALNLIQIHMFFSWIILFLDTFELPG
jgi:hypothetical protein